MAVLSTSATNTSIAYRRWTPEPALINYQRTWRPIRLTLWSILVITALTLSIVGLVTIYRVRRTRPYGFVRLLFSLMVTVLLSLVFVSMFDIIEWAQYGWRLGDALCRLHDFFTEALDGALSYQMLFVSVYMVASIKKPLWTQRLDDPRTASIFLGVFWLLVVLLSAEALFTSSAQGHFCNNFGRTSQHWKVIIVVTYLFLNYIPWFLLAGMAGYLFYVYHKEKGIQDYVTDIGSRVNLRDNYRAAMTFAGVFTIFKGPLLVLFTTVHLGFWTRWNLGHKVTYDILTFMWYVSNTLLPPLLLIVLSDLRFQVKVMLCQITGRAPPTLEEEHVSFQPTEDGKASLVSVKHSD